MSKRCKPDKCKTTEFVLQGRFLRFIVKDGYKLKGIVLTTPTGECTIKLSKAARASCPARLMPGMWVRVAGTQIWDKEDGYSKLKAERILAVATPTHGADFWKQPEGWNFAATEMQFPMEQAASAELALSKTNAGKASILICQKSDCCKLGGRAVTQAIEEALSDRQLTDQVQVKFTGCMKRCKAGPNIVMPDKTRYSGIRSQEIPQIIAKHFGASETEASRTLNESGSNENVTVECTKTPALSLSL